MTPDNQVNLMAEGGKFKGAHSYRPAVSLGGWGGGVVWIEEGGGLRRQGGILRELPQIKSKVLLQIPPCKSADFENMF